MSWFSGHSQYNQISLIFLTENKEGTELVIKHSPILLGVHRRIIILELQRQKGIKRREGFEEKDVDNISLTSNVDVREDALEED